MLLKCCVQIDKVCFAEFAQPVLSKVVLINGRAMFGLGCLSRSRLLIKGNLFNVDLEHWDMARLRSSSAFPLRLLFFSVRRSSMNSELVILFSPGASPSLSLTTLSTCMRPRPAALSPCLLLLRLPLRPPPSGPDLSVCVAAVVSEYSCIYIIKSLFHVLSYL